MRRPVTQRMPKAEGGRQKAQAPLPPQAAALAAQSGIANRKSPLLRWLPALALVLVTIAVYWPATQCDFVNYDDDAYVLANGRVQNGLTWENVQWACWHPVSCNWHPLTVWSHMAVCQVCGLKPWGHHFTNVVLHALNGGLVFVLLQQMTGVAWPSLLVAALFALHPLRVESVAWVSERKDVLSACFGLLALLAYVCYAQGRGREKSEARNPKPEGNPKSEARNLKAGAGGRWSLSSLPSSVFYLLSLFCFALGLMSKPMLVTWPFVMLLLDYWPLGRMQNEECRMKNAEASGTQHAARNTQHASHLTAQSPIANGRSPMANRQSPRADRQSPRADRQSPRADRQSPRADRQSQFLFPLLLEKLPFFALAAVASAVTFVVQQRGGSLAMGERLALSGRVGNALVSYCRHVGKLFWPADLAVFYPYPGPWPLGTVLLAAGVLLGVSALVWAQRQRHPYTLVGWLWFIGMLVPVIGLVQTGSQALADRHTYLPSLGVLILAIWGVGDLTRGWQYQALARSLGGGAVIVLCLALTRQQIGYWKDGETLFRHALEVTENNDVAHNGLGVALGQKGQFEEAIRQFREAIRLEPEHADSYNSLGAALGKQGHLDEAIGQFQAAIRLNPHHADAHDNLGAALYQKGQLDEAIHQLEDAIRLKPDHAEAHYNLGVALGGKGQTDEAITQYEEAARLKPGNADAHYNLGLALASKGQTDAAIRRFEAALQARPDYPEAHNHMGVALVRRGQTDEAIRQFQEALRLKPDYAGARKNLAAVLAAKGQSSPPPGGSLRP